MRRVSKTYYLKSSIIRLASRWLILLVLAVLLKPAHMEIYPSEEDQLIVLEEGDTDSSCEEDSPENEIGEEDDAEEFEALFYAKPPNFLQSFVKVHHQRGDITELRISVVLPPPEVG